MQKAIGDLVRRFVDNEILPHIAGWHETASVPRSIIDKIAELGILEMVVAEEMDPITYGLVMRELERGGSGIRSVVSVQGSLVLHPIMTYGSDEQKELARFVAEQQLAPKSLQRELGARLRMDL